MSEGVAVATTTVGHGPTAYWYLTRSTGLLSLVLLSATVVLGLVSSIGWTVTRWPRFLSQGLHRNLSLYCIVLVAVHVVTTVADGYVPIALVDAIVPFASPYRPVWVGLGAVAFDLMLVLVLTSALRRRIGVRAWREVHWLAYLCWPIAVLHGLGSGSDTRLPAGIAVYVLCVAVVAGALIWRLVSVPTPSASWRAVIGAGGAVTLIGTAIFALQGPLRSGWSRRAGTSAAVLAHISAASPSTSSSSSSSSSATGPGSESPARPSSSPPSTPAAPRPASKVEVGPEQGTVTALDGPEVSPPISGPAGGLELSLSLAVDQGTGTASGTVSDRGAP